MATSVVQNPRVDESRRQRILSDMRQKVRARPTGPTLDLTALPGTREHPTIITRQGYTYSPALQRVAAWCDTAKVYRKTQSPGALARIVPKEDALKYWGVEEREIEGNCAKRLGCVLIDYAVDAHEARLAYAPVLAADAMGEPIKEFLASPSARDIEDVVAKRLGRPQKQAREAVIARSREAAEMRTKKRDLPSGDAARRAKLEKVGLAAEDLATRDAQEQAALLAEAAEASGATASGATAASAASYEELAGGDPAAHPYSGVIPVDLPPDAYDDALAASEEEGDPSTTAGDIFTDSEETDEE